MKKIKLKKNSDGRFETYFKNEYYSTLTCGSRLYLPCEECDCNELIPGRVEHNIHHGYFWISDDYLQVEYLKDGLIGYSPIIS